jgi:hypothetical protein
VEDRDGLQLQQRRRDCTETRREVIMPETLLRATDMAVMNMTLKYLVNPLAVS